MPVKRNKRRSLHFSLALAFATIPNQIGFQDLGALMARQPAVVQRWRAHVFASPPALTQAAMFSLPRPLGTAIPQPPLYALASVDPNEIGPAFGRVLLGDAGTPLQFPSVNRKGKGDALVPRPRRPMPPRALTLDEFVPPVETEAPFADIAAARAKVATLRPTLRNDTPSRESHVYFGRTLLAAKPQRMQPWSRGAAPQIVGDPDVKLAALAPANNRAAEIPGET